MSGPNPNDQYNDGQQDCVDGNDHSKDERPDQHRDSHLVKDIESSEDDANEDGSDVDISCGVWKLRTTILGTCYSNLYVFALCVGISAMFSTMVEVVIPVQLTSLEKQFQIDNAKAGLLTSSSKFGLLVSVLVAGHFTRKANIPVVIGISGIIQGLLLMVPAVLQYTDPYELELVTKGDNTTNTTDGNSVYICASNGPSSNGTPLSGNTTSGPFTTKEVSQVAFAVVLVMQVLKGVTETFHSNFLPTVYMDDNVMDKTKMSLFMGITQMLTNLAQPLGTEINGLLTEIPVDLKATDMDATDGRFVAAWWLAFLIFGIGTTLSSIPLMLFPRQLVSKGRQQRALQEAAVAFAGGRFGDSQENQPTEKSALLTQSVHEDSSSKYYTLTGTDSGDSNSRHGSRQSLLLTSAGGSPDQESCSVQDVVTNQAQQEDKESSSGQESSIVELLKDFPKALLRLLKRPVYVLILIQIAITSIPMYGLMMFRSVYMSNEYNIPMSQVSYASGISSAVGQLSGTLVSSLLSSRVESTTGYVWILLATYLIQSVMNPLYIIFGCGNEMVYGATGEFGIPMNTSDGCNCTWSKLLLVCGDDGNNYQSPCYAGCTGVDGKDFTGCSRLANVTNTSMVTPGLCETHCYTNFLIYIGLHGVQYLVEGASLIPRNLLILRLVDPRDRAFAMSFFMFFSYVISVPSPNVFGTIIDDMCLIWDGDLCLLYDRDKIRYLLSGVDVGISLAVALNLFLILLILMWENKKLRLKLQMDEIGKENAISTAGTETKDRTGTETRNSLQ